MAETLIPEMEHFATSPGSAVEEEAEFFSKKKLQLSAYICLDRRK
jgi:hypothetical protein